MPASAENSPSSAKRHGPRAFLFIIVTVFIDMMAFAVIMPVMPKLIAELLNGREAMLAANPEQLKLMISNAAPWSGMITMFYAILNFVMQPVLGNLSDRFGRRPVLLVSMGMLSIDFMIMGLSHTIWLLFVGRLLTGISGATHSTASAYIADTTEPENRAKAYGMLGVAFGMGFILGPVIGGLLGGIDPRAPFFVSAALAGINFLYGSFVLPESLGVENRRAFDWKRANPVGAFLRFRKLPHLRWFLIAYGLFMFGHWVYPSTFAYFGQVRFGWDERMTGLALGAVGIGSALVQGTLMGWFIKTLGPTRTAIFGMCVSVAAPLAYAFAPSAEIVFGCIAFGALAGVLSPALNQIMTARVERNAQGELSGALASVQAFGSIFSPVVMTQTFHTFTSDRAPVYFPGAAFLLAAIVTALAIPPLLAGLRTVPKVAEGPSPSVAAGEADTVAAT